MNKGIDYIKLCPLYLILYEFNIQSYNFNIIFASYFYIKKQYYYHG